MRKLLSFIAVGMAAASLAPAPASARDLVYGTFVSPKHGNLVHGLVPMFQEIEKDTGGKQKWQVAPGGQIANGKATPTAIRDGLMDAGFALPPYVPNLEPATNLFFSSWVFFSSDAVAASGASLETLLLHCPQCTKEMQKLNSVALMSYSTVPYNLVCRNMVKTVADLKGLKVRASAGGVGLMRAAGAVPVAMSPAEATSALQRGTVDCVNGPLEWIRSYSYGDTAKSVVDYPMGMAGPVVMFQVNRKTWQSFTPAERRLYVKYAPGAIARTVMRYEYAEGREVLADITKRGVVVTHGGKDFDALVAAYDKVLRAENIAAAKKFGVQDPEAIIAAFDTANKKWQALSKDIGEDEGRFEAALKREIYDKIDPDAL